MKCRICGSINIDSVIDLGLQPWANNFLQEEEVGKEHFYPLNVVYCNDCHLAQLDYTVKKEIMFSDHTYLSGVTETTSAHFRNVAIDVDKRFFASKQEKNILDIGSNDGTQLRHYKELGYEVLGVESSIRTAKIANDLGINTLNSFFNLETMKEIGIKFDVINAAGVFYHLEELHSVCEGIKEGLADNGVFVVHFIYMKCIMENMTFDQIYHEHLLYYTLETIEKLLNLHGLCLFDAYLSPTHGGTIIGFACHKGERERSGRLKQLIEEENMSNCNSKQEYLRFNSRINELKQKTVKYLKEKKAAGKKIYGLGAPIKGNTMLNHFCIGTDILDCLAETNELRRNMFSPGMHIPVMLQREISTNPDIYFVLAWNFKTEILEKNKDLIAKGVEFYFPVEVE